MQENLVERYTPVRELGRGAISKVHAARDPSTGASAALKTLDPALLDAADKKLAGLFLENARAAARLRHANIVQVLDAGTAGGVAYVLMELVEGKSLRRLLDEKPLPIARAIRIFDDVASALAYAHEEGMVHRGVRPTSIFVLPSGAAKIGDFGIGQIGEAAAPYLAPEQVRGGPVDARTDLFSLGAVFYEMLTGRSPFAGRSQQEIRANILRAEPPKPSVVNPNVPAALDRLVASLLARRPEDRVASARLLLRDLQRLEDGLGLRPAVPTGPALPAAKVPPAPPRTEPTLNTPRFAEQLKAEEPRGPALRMPPPRAEEFRDHHRPIPMLPEFDEQDARYVRQRAPEPPRRSGSSLAVIALGVAVLSIGLTVSSRYLPALDQMRSLVNRSQEAPAVTAAPTPPAQPAPAVAEPVPAAPKLLPPTTVATTGTQEAPRLAPWPSQPDTAAPIPAPARPITPPPAAKPIATAQEETVPVEPKLPEPKLPEPKVEQPTKVIAAPPPPPAPAAKPMAITPAKAQPAGRAKLLIAVEPRGEIYIDGQHAGTTPPVTTLDLEPGLHRIEIRSGSRTPYLTYMNVEPGDQRRIRHDFNAKGRPPV
jgi:serine/threonine-protein kinase